MIVRTSKAKPTLRSTISILFLSLGVCGIGQGIYPEDSHVNLNFPHLADGGSVGQRWQTRFTFVNPDPTTTVNVALMTFADDGSAWSLNLGSGARSELDFAVPPLGRMTFVSQIASQNITTGWAVGFSDIPLQATVAFREIVGSTPALDLTAPATLPSSLYRSAGNRNLGIAVANQYNATLSVSVTALDSKGTQLGVGQVSIPAYGHRSFNLGQLIPSLPAGFLGSVVIGSSQSFSDQFLAWTANEDSGMLSTLPSGRADWPISHDDRIWLVFLRVLTAARQMYPHVNFDAAMGIAQAAVQLDTPAQVSVNNRCGPDAAELRAHATAGRDVG